MADDLRLNVEVAARSTGVTAVLAQMNALSKATRTAATAQGAYSKAQAATAASSKAAASGGLAQATAATTAATALSRASASQREVNDQSLRYASYDMAGTFLTVAAAIAAVGAASAIAFAQQEKAFSSVERILAGDGIGTEQVAELRSQLIGLSEEIPIAFTELSEIASFGAALDIESDNLDEFASVVSRFVALTGADAETAGKSLARIFQYTDEASPSLRQGEEFEQLGSAVVRLGNVSIATENDVLKFAQAIAPLGSRAGVSAEQILAMATATASFASINVEGAGSAFSRVFANLDRVVGQGGDSLAAFAKVSGTTASEFEVMWGDDAGGAFNQVIAGLNRDLPNLTQNLDALGIRNERDRRVVTALAVNYQDYARYLGESNKAIEEGTFLGESYAFIADDLASKWSIFINTLVNTASVVGGLLAPGLTMLLDIMGDLLKSFQDFASTPVGGFLTKVAGAALTLVAIWAGMRGGLALVTAGFLALRTATSFLGGVGLVSGVQGLANQMGFLGGQTLTVRSAFTGLVNAGKSVLGFFGGPWGAAFTAAAIAVTAWSTHVASEAARAEDNVLNSLTNTADSVRDTMATIADTQDTPAGLFDFSQTFSSAEEALTGLEASAGRLGEVMGFIGEQGFFTPNAGIQEMSDALGITYREALSLDNALESAGSALNGLSGAEAVSGLLEFGEVFGATNKELFQFAKSEAPEALQQVLALGAQANLTGSQMEIFNQVLSDQQRAAQNAADGSNLASEAFASTSEEAADLTQQLDALVDAFLGLSTGSKSIQQAQDDLSEAMNRARAEADGLIESGGNLSNVLTNTDDASLSFRDSLFSLEESARASSAAMVTNGQSVEDAAAEYLRGRDDVVALLTQMGVAPQKAQEWADRMFRPSKEIKGYLDDIKISAQEANNQDVYISTGSNADATILNLSRLAQYVYDIDGLTATITTYRNTVFQEFGPGVGTSGHVSKFPALQFASGGYTGAGGKYSPAGIVHRGEYVIPKHLVNQSTGLPYADALGKLVKGAQGTGYANGGFVNPTVSMPSSVSLTPGTIQQIAAAVQPFLVVENQVIGRAADNQHARATTIGAY